MFKSKLQELNDEEINTIVGGDKKDIDFDLIPAPGSRPDITKRIKLEPLQKVFSDNPSTSTFTDENTRFLDFM